jgi:hypothetical protein
VLAALPRRRDRSLSPAWALAPALVLASLIWMFRQELSAGLLRMFGWFGIDLGRAAIPALPVPTVPQALLVAAVVGLVAVGLTVTTAVLTWRRISG